MISITLTEYVDMSGSIMIQAELNEDNDFTHYLFGNGTDNDNAILELKDVVAKRIEALQNIDYSKIELIPLEENDTDDY